MIPSLFPVVQLGAQPPTIHDGTLMRACAFCRHAIEKKTECQVHYSNISTKPEGYYQCPFGFTTRTFGFGGAMWAISGVVAFPRYDTPAERQRAKSHPEIKTTREAIDKICIFFSELENLRAETIVQAAQVLPQAFHELRKLNGAILQHAEKELRNDERPSLRSIRSAAELVRNNYDILEALSNIDAMKAVPLDATVNLFDLCYKTRSIFLERASARSMYLEVNGDRAIIRGNQKSFPIVPAVLIENAIKFGLPGTSISIEVSTVPGLARIVVANASDFPIDPVHCFDRGVRYAGTKVEGSGFGLFLAREIVDAHRGSLRCEWRAGTIQMIAELPLEKVIDHQF